MHQAGGQQQPEADLDGELDEGGEVLYTIAEEGSDDEGSKWVPGDMEDE